MEQTKKTNKKKLVVALALLALIVVASVITTVVLVLAAPQQNVGSNIDVTYSVDDVSATVSGQWGLKTTTGKDVLDTAMTDAITINPTDTTANGVEPKTAIALTSNESYVVFEYKIVNNADNEFSVGLSYRDNSKDSAGNVTDASKADKNVIVGYHAQTTSLDENADYSFNTVYDATQTGNEWATGWKALGDSEVDCGDCYANGTTDNDETADVTESDTLYVYIIVMVDNLSQAASFSGELNFSLIAA